MQPSTYSKSAIGHQAWVRLLQNTGRRVLISRNDSVAKADEGGMLVLAGRAADVGQSRVELPIGYDGREITITLDPRFVVDFLKVLDAEKTFTLEIKDSDSAAMCSTDDGYAYVIMPLARDR